MTFQKLISFSRVFRAGRGAACALLAAVAPAAAEDVLPAVNLPLAAWTVVARETGLLKEELDKVGTKTVTLVPPGAADLIGAEAALLNRGGIAIAQRMIYPATVHRANGLDAVIVWESAPSDEYRTPILAAAGNTAVNSVADLEGKKFASSRVSGFWTSPFEILDKAGLPLDTRQRAGKVRYASIDNLATTTAALLSGAIDATAAHIAIPAAAAAYTSGQVKVIGRSPNDGVYVNGAGRVSYFVMRDFVNRYPRVVRAFLIAHERTKDWIAGHIDEAAGIISRETRVPLHIARFQITDHSSYEFMKGERSAENARKTIKEFQAWYIAHGDDILAERRLTDAQIDAFVDGRFFEGGEYSIYN